MHDQKARVLAIQSIHFYQLRTKVSLSAWHRKNYTLSLWCDALFPAHHIVRSGIVEARGIMI